ncbi:hypothetical protein EBV26_01175, partial [bacterium]|nr:hypothetical protein [bacterium]
PALDSGKVYKAGLGISISNDSIINTGTINFFTASRDTVGANLSKAAHRWIASSTSNPSIDIVLSPKGSGAFLVNLPDNFVSGGDKRGNYAVDLQLARGESADVAKSSFSNILGGYSNEISSSSDYSKIGGGSDNKITTSTYAAIIGGWFNSIKTGSNYSSIGGGSLNTIQKQYGTIAGGTENNVNALYGTISGGGLNVIDPAGYVGTIGGGASNKVSDSTAVVGGGFGNQALGKRSTVSGGIYNTAKNWYSTVSGGALNSALAEGSAVIGGIEMVLDTTAVNSFGFNGNIINNTNSLYARKIIISQPRTGVFNNVHLWLTNNDDTVRTLRFYEKYNTVGAFPNGTNYVAFKAADAIATDMVYTLPSAAPASSGQVLASTTGGVLSWINPGGNINDFFEFADLNPGNQSAIQAHMIRPLGTEDDIDFVASPKGKGSFMFDYPDNSATGGAKRGSYSIDFQMLRNTQHQVTKADTAAILGGFANEIGNNAHTSVIIGGALNTASAYQSTVLGGRSNTASGQYSLVGGLGNTSGSYGETVFGFYATDVNGTTSSAVSTDRLFAIGNGTSSTRSTAFSILKNGNTNISGTLDVNNNVSIGGGSSTSELRLKEASGTGSNYVGFKSGNATADMVYTLPTSAPTENGQFMVSNTNGTMSWKTPIVKAQNINVDPGNLLEYGGSESIAITVTGAQVGATVQVSPRTEMEGGIIIGYARVSAADTVSIRFVNTTNAAVNPAAVNVDVTVIQP